MCTISFRLAFMSNTWDCVLCFTKNGESNQACAFCAAEPPTNANRPSPSLATDQKDSSSPPASLYPSSSMASFFWQCRYCTLHNPFKQDTCEGCGRSRFHNKRSGGPQTSSASVRSEIEELPPTSKRPKLNTLETWHCRFCTLENASDAKECLCCESPKTMVPQKESATAARAGPRLIVIDDDDSDDDIEFISASQSSQSTQVTEKSTGNTSTAPSSGATSTKFGGLEVPVELEFSDALKGACVQCEVCGCEFLLEDLEALNEHAALHVSGFTRPRPTSGNGSSHTQAIVVEDEARDGLRVGLDIALSSVLGDDGMTSGSSQHHAEGSSSSSSSSSSSRVPLDTAYEQQYARSFGRAFKMTLSPAQIADRLRKMSAKVMSTDEDLEDAEKGAMQALEEHYTIFPKAGREVILATSKVVHMSSGHGDKGWGCGYRNIQMLSSALMELPHFRKSLFGGIGHGVPSILILQQCLEAAWAEGFDPGSQQRLEGVYGGNSWIGTYDACALLRHFGVPMQLQSFGAIKRSESLTFALNKSIAKKGGNANPGGLVQTTIGTNGLLTRQPRTAPTDYGRNVSGNNRVVEMKDILAKDKDKAADSKSTFKYSRFQAANYVPHVEMFNWVWTYFFNAKRRQEEAGVPIMPLYLQHDGHSRTIVGAERQSGRIALLLFDPSFSARQLPTTLLSQEAIPDVVRKTLSEFRHENYQIAFVSDPSTPIPPHKRAQSKSITQPRMLISE